MTAVRAVAAADTGALPLAPAVMVLAIGSCALLAKETETVVGVVDTCTSNPLPTNPAAVR